MATDPLRPERRLALLQILAQQPEYFAAAPVLRTLLRRRGLSASLSVLRGDLLHLQALCLVGLSGDALPVATLTREGEDVAAGRALAPDVAQPAPGE